ncbi:glycosyltransferase family 4 protein [Pelomonas sp. KK5]|uniref:glycosyltransferase family 4 protein n=1 Tax=Pelomonas sp. KK5 TaxID=1855730 RepID=UPI00097BED91|nr:glycosyltransferase family 4 protein [Pelomonas sp. KK5]
MMQVAERRPRLAFVSPQFLFPNDTGGRIRTTNILRGLKGGAFEIVLVCMASDEQRAGWAAEIAGVCDEFVPWTPSPRRPNWRRVIDLLGELPANVVVDKSAAGMAAVQRVLARPDIDVVVFDFVHAAVLRATRPSGVASLCFTHNVEAEIFRRHAEQAKDPARRLVWSSQFRKMERFEREALHGFDTVIAVSERDARQFREQHGLRRVRAIPTGVDLDFFRFKPMPEIDEQTPPTVVFTGSMDWDPNIDGIRFFVTEVWPRVLAKEPRAQFKVVGRTPPPALVQLTQQTTRNVDFTGRVDDVRTYVWASQVFVIPLLVGGGTRIKAFEAMAMGCPIVSTSIGMEGLDTEPERDWLCRDDAAGLAEAVLALLGDASRRKRIAVQARELVERRFGHRVAASVFEQICLEALAQQQQQQCGEGVEKAVA